MHQPRDCPWVLKGYDGVYGMFTNFHNWSLFDML